MSELKECLKELHDNYAILFPPLEPRLAQQASVRLVKAGVPPIPLDYVLFLAQTNGLSWNGMDLFALENIERNKGAFVHPGIMQNFSFCQNNAVMTKKLLLGYGWEELLVYDFGQKEYQLMDRYAYDVVATFPTILDFLCYIAKSIHKSVTPGLNVAATDSVK